MAVEKVIPVKHLPRSKETMPYCAEVEITWLDHENNFQPKSRVMIFRGKDKADLDLNIRGYARHNGLHKTEIISEKDISNET